MLCMDVRYRNVNNDLVPCLEKSAPKAKVNFNDPSKNTCNYYISIKYIC